MTQANPTDRVVLNPFPSFSLLRTILAAPGKRIARRRNHPYASFRSTCLILTKFVKKRRTRGSTDRIFGMFHSRFGYGGVLLIAALCGVWLLSDSASALTTLSQGYATKDNVVLGSIVSIEKDAADQVYAATIENPNSILGVVISDGNSLLSVTSGGAKQIQVATSGVAQVLVSDINGEITRGDQITASPIQGVGMKATDNTKVVGIAQDDLTEGNGSPQEYTDKDGQKHKALVGEVPVLVNVSYFYKQPNKTIVPSAIQNIANAFAGKKVSPLPVLISVGIFLITLAVVASMVYSMIRSSIISVGRNPMAQAAVYRNLLQMSTLMVGILAVSVIAIYMILTRF